MDEKTLFLQFWKKEAPASRRVISRIPEEKSDYKPDPKSRSARELAWVLVFEEKWLVEGLEKGRFDWPNTPPPSKVKEILDMYDRGHEELTRRLERLDDGVWGKKMPLTVGGAEIMNEPGSAYAWLTLFDQVHHRGQLSTYLRPMGSKVPSIYGPSADENPG